MLSGQTYSLSVQVARESCSLKQWYVGKWSKLNTVYSRNMSSSCLINELLESQFICLIL